MAHDSLILGTFFVLTTDTSTAAQPNDHNRKDKRGLSI
jgi:hypothetical protein